MIPSLLLWSLPTSAANQTGSFAIMDFIAIRFNQNHREAHTWLGNSFDAAATPDLISATQNNAGLEPAFAHLESTRTAAAKASGE
jgi:hypothetical protein